MGHLTEIYNQYKNDADFLAVYVREAHPTDEWQMDSNVKDDVCYPQPHSMADRLKIANDFSKRYKFNIPLVVDSMANTANNLYSAWPERLYLIEPNGTLSYVGGLGPFNYHPQEVRDLLAKRFPDTKPPAPEQTSAPAATPAATK